MLGGASGDLLSQLLLLSRLLVQHARARGKGIERAPCVVKPRRRARISRPEDIDLARRHRLGTARQRGLQLVEARCPLAP